MRANHSILAGMSASLLVSMVVRGEFTGLKGVVKADPANPRLFIWNLHLSFDDPGDRAVSVNGFIPALGQPELFFRTNSSGGFHQEQFFGSDRNFAVSAAELGVVPALAVDTYFNVGIKSGEVTSGGVASGTPDDISSSAPSGILFGWNGGGKQLESNPATGGTFDLVDVAPPISDQNIAGATPNGNQVFLAQFVIDINFPTNDGGTPLVEVQLGSVVWQDAAGSTFVEGFDPSIGAGCPLTIKSFLTPCIPVPGDADGNGFVNVNDLVDLLTCFGFPATDPCHTGQDANCDGTVNVLDLVEVLVHFGCNCFCPCPPPPGCG